MSIASQHIESKTGGHRHPYPMAPPAGLFLLLIGMGIVGAVLFSGSALVNYVVLLAGSGLAMVSLLFVKALSLGKPTRIQIVALVAAIVLEVALFIVMDRMLPPDTEKSVQWMWGSVVVGVHFFPMAISFGPRLLGLGTLCILSAGAGLFLTSVATGPLLILDGTLKIAFGVWLFSDKVYTRKPSK